MSERETFVTVTLKTEDVEPRTGDFAIWESDDGEKHIVRVRANDHGRVYFNFQGSDRGDYSSNLTVIGTLITEPTEKEKPEEQHYWDKQVVDKPGVWAIKKRNSCEVSSLNIIRVPEEWSHGGDFDCCYLGPVPVIVNRPVPVTLRMWGEPIHGGDLMKTHWFRDGDETPKGRGFVRIDITKQV